jgi:hypothetical protein
MQPIADESYLTSDKRVIQILTSMKVKYHFLFTFFCFCMVISSAQETRQKFLGIEAGMNLIAGEMTNMDYVRGEIPFYSEGSSTNNLTSLMYTSFFGIKSEAYSLNNKFGLLAGVRYTRVVSSVGKNSYWSNSTNYFYLLYLQEGTNTEYLKVKEIKQSSNYLGIPVEIRFSPFKPRLIRPYFKLGAEISFRLNSRTDVLFFDDAMEPYQKDVAVLVGEPRSVSSTVYGSGGIRLGREFKPNISFEICLPAIYLTGESSGLVNPISGGGFQLNVQIPIKSKAQ